MTHQDLPPEIRLLLLAAQPGRDPADLKAVLQGDHDWSTILTLAQHHRIEPLIYLTLEKLVPPEIHQVLKHEATRNTLSAIQAAAELRRLTTALPTLIALKGIALSQLLYGSPNARHVGDLDLLTTLPAPVEALQHLGYHIVQPEAPLTPRRLLSYTRTLKDITFEHTQNIFELDLHWRLFNNPRHPANALLPPTTVPVTVYNVTLQTLPLQDQFLYTTAHALNESFTYLKTLVDISAFLRLMSPPQLDAALTRARTIGLLPQISAAIHLANSWMLTAHTSPNLLPATNPLAVKLARRVESLFTRSAFMPSRTGTSPAAWSRFEYLLTPTPRTLVEQAHRFLVRPRLWQVAPLPDALFFLYPLVALLLPPRLHSAGQSQAAPRTPLESPNKAGKIGVSNSPPNA